MAQHHLVHANVAIMRAPLDDPSMAGFVGRMDEIDALAQDSPGFVGQPALADEGEVFTGRALLNVSIWESPEDLLRFVHHGEHAVVMERRHEWFEPQAGPNYVLYWKAAGDMPTEKEIKDRLDYLANHGPTPYAFNFQRTFTFDELSGD